jgi:alkylated DNA repair dioxygenase AlkB
MAYYNNTPPKVFQRTDERGNLFWTDTDEVNIPGFYYIPEYLTREDEQQIMAILDNKHWIDGIKRRTQHYGYTYYHTRHNIPALQPKQQPESHTGGLSDFQPWLDKIMHYFPANHPPTQCLVNEYVGNQGIASHVDNPNCFGDVIVAFSLLKPVYMTFRPVEDFNKEIKILLEPRSLMVLENEARFKWRHGSK